MKATWVLWAAIGAVILSVIYVFRSAPQPVQVVGSAPASVSALNAALGLAPSALSAIDGALGTSSFFDNEGDDFSSDGNYASEGVAPTGGGLFGDGESY